MFCFDFYLFSFFPSFYLFFICLHVASCCVVLAVLCLPLSCMCVFFVRIGKLISISSSDWYFLVRFYFVFLFCFRFVCLFFVFIYLIYFSTYVAVRCCVFARCVCLCFFFVRIRKLISSIDIFVRFYFVFFFLPSL